MEQQFSMKDALPFAAMVIVECGEVGMITLGKAAMNRGLSNLVYVVYYNTLGTLLHLPYFIIHIRRYQIPLALVGLILSLAMWDLFRVYGDRWGLDSHPIVQLTLVRLAQFATAIILFWSNVQLALLCALLTGYVVMILHASF